MADSGATAGEERDGVGRASAGEAERMGGRGSAGGTAGRRGRARAGAVEPPDPATAVGADAILAGHRQARELLAELSERAGCAVPELRVGRCAGLARVGLGRHGSRVLLDPTLLVVPAEVLRPLLAHELGHLRLGHLDGGSRRRRTAEDSAVLAPGLVLVLLFAVALLGASTVGAVLAVLAAAVPCLAVLAVAAAARARRSRARELAADRYALTVLREPPTPELIAFLGAGRAARRPPRWTRWWWSHPDWSERLHAGG